MNNPGKARFCVLWSLVFNFFFVGCTEKREPGSISIQWEGDKAVAIIVPQKFFLSIPEDSVDELLRIHLAKSEQQVIGDYSFRDDNVIFKPAIAFTRGLKYHLYVRNDLIEEIIIPNANVLSVPKIAAVYPALDTLPENLLKFYISFSKPMQEGDALENIHLLKDGHDTLSSVFLDMELWNNERTMLTLWLDPGRIKRDLQPNKLLGPPLSKGSRYQLTIDKTWQDADGILLKESFIKNFFTGEYDSLSPDVQRWTIDVPKAKTKQQLKINFIESLDHLLAQRTISVAYADGKEVKGKLLVNDQGTIAYFTPDIEWAEGNYILQIESRLEDLAGNNMDRLFDTDLNQKKQPSNNIHKRQFDIK